MADQDSNDSQPSDSEQESLIETSDDPDFSYQDEVLITQSFYQRNNSGDARMPGKPPERSYGNLFFWNTLFDSNDDHPLNFSLLPKFTEKVADLQIIAASKYQGRTEILPQVLATRVEQIRVTKALIFGVNSSGQFINRVFPKTNSYRMLYQLLCQKLAKINQNQSASRQRTGDLYNYRVSFNGVLCGTLPGPPQITRSFIRWIHLNFLLYTDLRVHPRYSKRKSSKNTVIQRWNSIGLRVYRFTPIPYVTVLRVFLRKKGSNRIILMHVARECHLEDSALSA